FARYRHRTIGSTRIPCLRNAAALADELRADAAVACPDCALLEAPLQRKCDLVGHQSARPLHAAAFCGGGHARCRLGSAARGLSCPLRIVRTVLRVSFSALWYRGVSR